MSADRSRGSPLLLVQPFLRRGERVIWAESAGPAALARQMMLPALFGVPFLAFAVFWTVMAAGGASKGGAVAAIFPLFGIPFILVGLGLVMSPLWAFVRGRRVLYAITDQRALIVSSGFSKRVDSYQPQDMDRLEVLERGDGSGDVVFRREVRPRAGFTISGVRRIGFYGVPEVRRVEAVLADMRRSAVPAAT